MEGQGRDEDALAYFREAIDYRNALIMELPKGDFAFTVVRQCLVSVHAALVLDQLQHCAHPDLAGIAAKAHKEARYHARHAADWMLKLGDGTAESHERAQRALDDLWRFTGELFDVDAVERRLAAQRLAVDAAALAPRWRAEMERIVDEAALQLPADGFMQRGGRQGRHTEHLGHMLAEMQIVARSFPGGKW